MQRGIPTEYAHYRFRSRLEARWAMFFDLCGWPWEYEPFDLAGYIPDFALKFRTPILVEIKPVVALYEYGQLGGISKIEACGWQNEVLLLGAGFPVCEDFSAPCLGLLAERMDGQWCWGPAALISCPGCQHLSLAHGIQSFRCRRCSHHDGGHLPWDRGTEHQRHWAEAANRTQWMARDR